MVQSDVVMLNLSLQSLVSDVLTPLVASDGGRLVIIDQSAERLSLHLSGAYAGCPGNTLAIRRVMEPLIRAYYPRIQLTITSGARLPAGGLERSTDSSEAADV
jgi:Fe-S cluster biogenesis protein NfuA